MAGVLIKRGNLGTERDTKDNEEKTHREKIAM
jgi:hypothetical protein